MNENKPRPIEVLNDPFFAGPMTEEEEKLFKAIMEGFEENWKASEAEKPERKAETEEYISIEDIARENGFWIDDDGEWQDIEEDW